MIVLPPLSLYVHMPWCVSKCPYCDFNSYALRDGLDEDRYIQALLTDLECDLPYVAERSLSTIFIGGGTPSLYSADTIEHLLGGIKERVSLAPDCEITLEANPESVSCEHLKALHKAGVKRLSIGIQSFNNKALQHLRRAHDSTQAERAIQAALDAGFKNFNLDLMFGLPEQSYAEGMDDVRRAIAFQPSHISYYQLTIEPNTEFYKNPPVLPQDDDIFKLQSDAILLLQEHGYQQYEVSAFAKKQCAHNLNYWRFGDYLGIGAGAHGKLSISLPSRIVRTRKTRQPQSYIERALQKQCRVEEKYIAPQDLTFEFLMNVLRLSDGVEKDLFSKRTGLPLDCLEDAISEQVQSGRIRHDQKRLKVEPSSYLFLDKILEDCLPDTLNADASTDIYPLFYTQPDAVA